MLKGYVFSDIAIPEYMGVGLCFRAVDECLSELHKL